MSLSTVDTHPARTGTRHSQASPARIGPNTVIQTLAAVEELEGTPTRDRVARLAGLPAAEPAGMIAEATFLDLLSALRRELDAETAREVLVLSGEKTGDYVAANRIPGPFRSLLGWLPARISIPLLLAAFRHHARTVGQPFGPQPVHDNATAAAPGRRASQSRERATDAKRCQLKKDCGQHSATSTPNSKRG